MTSTYRRDRTLTFPEMFLVIVASIIAADPTPPVWPDRWVSPEAQTVYGEASAVKIVTKNILLKSSHHVCSL